MAEAFPEQGSVFEEISNEEFSAIAIKTTNPKKASTLEPSPTVSTKLNAFELEEFSFPFPAETPVHLSLAELEELLLG